VAKVTWDDLSELERWQYVNQDCVRSVEFLPRKQIYDIQDSYLCGVDFDTQEKLKEAVIGLHEDGKNVDEIAYHVPCSHRHIRRIIQKTKNKIIKMYKSGWEIDYIANEISCSIGFVKEILKNNKCDKLDERKREIQDLYKKGISIKRICLIVGCKKTAVYECINAKNNK